MFLVLLIIQYISIVVLAFESLYVFFHWRTKPQSYLFVYMFTTLITNVAYLMVMNAQTMEESFVGARFGYLGKVWISISFFAMTMELCEVKIPKKIYAGMTGIHLSVFFLAFTSGHHNLFYGEKREFVQSGLFPHNVYSHAFFYNAYMALMPFYIVIGIVVLIRKYRNTNDKKNRELYRYLIFAIAAMGTGLAVYLMGLTKGYDSTVLGYAVASVFMFVAIFKYHLMDTLSMVKDYVIDTLSEGVLATEKNGEVIYYNQTLKTLYPQIEKKTKDILGEIVETAERNDVICYKDKVYEPKGKPLTYEGEFRGNLYVLSDVTDRYHHMEQLRKQKEIAENAHTSKSMFLSLISHEIRTPMNAIVGMTDLILRDEEHLSTKQTKYLHAIQNSGSALVRIVNDILDRSEIEAGKMEIVEEVYELRPMVENVRSLFENRIEDKPIHLITDIDSRIPQYLEGDSFRLRQVLINLFINAEKYTQEGYIKLEVECVEDKEESKQLRFSVKDSGQGIKPENLEKLRDMISGEDSWHKQGKEGATLGISISKDFISMMGGQLQVASQYGEGSEFFFTISQKIAKNPNSDSRTGIYRQPWQEDVQFVAPQARVLIVDDMDLNLMIMEEFLTPLQMKVDTANSGEKAVEMVKNNTYHVIFMDYMMPGLDGIETSMRIRSEAIICEEGEERIDYYKSVPIIALSGENSDRTKEKFLRAGIDDFAEKPVEIKLLKKILLKWLPEELVLPDKERFR